MNVVVEFVLRGVKHELGDFGVDFVSCQEIPMGSLVVRVGHVMDNSFTRVLNERVPRSPGFMIRELFMFSHVGLFHLIGHVHN